jgi:soluble lytic murein transglycosylase-like protein
MPTSIPDLAAGAAAKWSAALGVAVPPELVLAIIAIESHGDTNAVGTSGERGLMQVMPGTARELGLTDPSLLADPVIGVYYGTEYLAQQLQRYGGKIPPAVAAYNAGSARYTDDEKFVNQPYVDRVLERFRQLTQGGTPGLALGVAAVIGVALFVWSRS